MEQKEIKLKPKKKSLSKRIFNWFADKKKRGLHVFLCILPFLIGIVVCCVVIFSQAKTLLNLVKGNSEVNDTHKITSMNYVLRDDATNYQEELFTKLKEAVEGEEKVDDQTLASLVAENFVADFFTWSNKQGQYDVGGLYYVYDGELPGNQDYKPLLYTQARDGFYKYLSNYIKEYGSDNLLRVDSVEVLSCSKSTNPFKITEKVGFKEVGYDEEEGKPIYERDYQEIAFDTYLVNCQWTYKPSEKFPTSNYVDNMYFVVIKRNDRFEIAMSDTKPIVIEDIESNETFEEESEMVGVATNEE